MSDRIGFHETASSPSETVKRAAVSGMAAYKALCRKPTDYAGFWARQLPTSTVSWKQPFLGPGRSEARSTKVVFPTAN